MKLHNIDWPELEWLPSTNCYRGRGGYPAEVLVIHYTAGRGDVRGLARVFAARSRMASAHFGIGRDGSIGQFVSLDDAAWHAGDGKLPGARDFDAFRSSLPSAQAYGTAPQRAVPLSFGFAKLNYRSVGIELCNRGWASGGANPRFEGRHRNPAARSTSWEQYSAPQLLALRSLVVPLRKRFPELRYVCGHEDVTHRDTLGEPGGKLDPGPAFDWGVLAGLGLTRVLYDFKAQAWQQEVL